MLLSVLVGITECESEVVDGAIVDDGIPVAVLESDVHPDNETSSIAASPRYSFLSPSIIICEKLC